MKRKKKDTPYLDFYEKCVRIGAITHYRYGRKFANGLCNSEIRASVMDWFIPYNTDVNEGWWGTEIDSSEPNVGSGFCPLRQNIVLLLSCINEEY